jgi:hypothetical protein
MPESVEIHRHRHIIFIVNNRQKKWGFLKKLCKYANHEIFLRLYKTYLLPLLEYANLCWIPSDIQNAKIESVQRHITKFICYKKGLSNPVVFTRKLPRAASVMKCITVR